MFNLKRPCKHCPFRTDIPAYLHRERMREIADAQSFFCHSTVDYNTDDGDGEVVESTQLCAGWLIVQEKCGRPAATLQVAARLNMYDPSALDMSAPVHENFYEAINAQQRS